MAEVVYFALDRERALAIAGVKGPSGASPRPHSMDAIKGREDMRAAMEVDPEELIDRLARAIDPWSWDQERHRRQADKKMIHSRRERSREKARAALMALAGATPPTEVE